MMAMNHARHDFQRLASEQGRMFAESALFAIKTAGFQIRAVGLWVREFGIQIDCVAENQLEIPFYFEFKGSLRPPRPGMQRTDTVKKAIANAAILDWGLANILQCPTLQQFGPGPYVVLTSHIPEDKSSKAMLDVVPRRVLLAVIKLYDHFRALQWLAQENPEDHTTEFQTWDPSQWPRAAANERSPRRKENAA